MDLSKVKTSDWVIAGSGVLLFIASFLKWFTAEVSGFGSASANGWDVGFGWAGIPVILGLGMIALVAVRALSPQTQLPALPIDWGLVLFLAGCLAAFIVVLKLLIGEDDGGAAAFGVEIKRSFGLFLAALSSIGLAVGGFLTWQGEKSGELAFNTSGPGGAGGPGYPQGPGGPGYQQQGPGSMPPPPPAGGPGAPPPPPGY